MLIPSAAVLLADGAQLLHLLSGNIRGHDQFWWYLAWHIALSVMAVKRDRQRPYFIIRVHSA